MITDFYVPGKALTVFSQLKNIYQEVEGLKLRLVFKKQSTCKEIDVPSIAP